MLKRNIIPIIYALILVTLAVVSILVTWPKDIYNTKELPELYKPIKAGKLWITKVPGGVLYHNSECITFVKDEKKE